jgi:hypothetical protein
MGHEANLGEIAMLPAIGPMEVVILLTTLLFWAGVLAFVVFVIRSLLRGTNKDHTIATLVEENQRLRDALAEK